MGYSFITENLQDFMGTGLFFVIFLCALLFLWLSMKNNQKKIMVVLFPLYVLFVFFCPLWLIYAHFRDDAEILYRVLWMVPMAIIICYAAVRAIGLVHRKYASVAYVVVVLVIVLSGQYVYTNRQFHKAENVYHIPQTVIDICDEITVPGREIRACFPIEMIQYVRQYTAYVCQPYGRDTLLWGTAYDEVSTIAQLLTEEVLDTKEICAELRRSDTPYFIVSKETHFTESLSNYDFYYVTSIDDYDIYLDNKAYIGIDFINHR